MLCSWKRHGNFRESFAKQHLSMPTERQRLFDMELKRFFPGVAIELWSQADALQQRLKSGIATQRVVQGIDFDRSETICSL